MANEIKKKIPRYERKNSYDSLISKLKILDKY